MRIPLAAFVVLVLLIGVMGCQQVSRERHPWQSRGDAFSFAVDTVRWPSIERRCLGRVAAEHVAEACDLLREAEAVEIPPAQASLFCPAAQFDFAGPSKPFLIRGVSYGRPAYTVARMDKESGWLYLLQATWDGEMYIPGIRFRPAPAPIVVLLGSRPVKVVSAAMVGGDWIFRGVDRQKTWAQ